MNKEKKIAVGAPNTMTFNIESYNGNKLLMMDAVASALKILTENEYECLFRYEDVGIYVLEFGYNHPEWGTPTLHWCDNELLDVGESMLENNDEEE